MYLKLARFTKFQIFVGEDPFEPKVRVYPCGSELPRRTFLPGLSKTFWTAIILNTQNSKGYYLQTSIDLEKGLKKLGNYFIYLVSIGMR